MVAVAVAVAVTVMMGTAFPAYAASVDLTGKKVTAVDVTGNIAIPKAQIMKVVKLKPGDALTPDKVKQDMQAIYDMGYFFDITADFKPVPEGVEVQYRVMENPVLQDIVVKGNTKVTTDKIKSMVTLKKGDIVNSKTLSDNVRAIEEYYREQGYIFAKVEDVNMSPGGVLTLTINEGMLEQIQVKGNEKTKTYVITREMKLKPGQPFNAKDAKLSMQRVYNLGYFQDVNMKLLPGREPNGVILETDVVEQKTGTFSIGGGYSSANGMVGIVELGDNDFRGTGDKIKIHWEFGGNANVNQNKNYEFSYTRPWLDSKQTSLGFNVYDMTQQYNDYYTDGSLRSTYDRRGKGYDITLGRPQGDYIHNYITLKNRDDIWVDAVSGEDYSQNPTYMHDNFGVTHSVQLTRVYDSRDNIFDPTQGNRVQLSAEFAGHGLGGDFNYNKYTAETRNYFDVGSNHVIAVKVNAGYANANLPETSQFYVGGADSLRGYQDNEFQGNKMFTANAEYRFPIVKKVQGVVFTDAGNAWSGAGYHLSGLHAAAGVGIRVNTPLGPIRIDYGVGSQGSRTDFSFGGDF
jgi:outer membrane protein insertion porin family